MTVDTDVRWVEHLLWSGEAAAADDLAKRVEDDLAAGPVAVLPSTLARLRGWAALRLGEVEQAEAHFRRGLALAEHEAFDYEVALALDALVGSGSSTVTDAERRQLAELLHDLDIAQAPRPPWLHAA